MPFAPTKTRAATAFLGLALAGFAAACTATAGTNSAPLACEIALDAIPGGTRLAGMVTSDRPVAGSYEMRISSRSSGGSASIRQSGDFAAPAGRTMIAETELSGTPASQSVDLSIQVGSQRMACADPAM